MNKIIAMLGAFACGLSLVALPATACNGDGGKKPVDVIASAGSVAAMGLEAKSSEMRDPLTLYKRSCIGCHSGGSAPVAFKPALWQSRLKKGMPTLVNSVMKGVRGMPAMGFCTDCSEQEIEAIIRMMVAPKPE